MIDATNQDKFEISGALPATDAEETDLSESLAINSVHEFLSVALKNLDVDEGNVEDYLARIEECNSLLEVDGCLTDLGSALGNAFDGTPEQWKKAEEEIRRKAHGMLQRHMKNATKKSVTSLLEKIHCCIT